MNGEWEDKPQEHCEWVHEPGEHCAFKKTGHKCDLRKHRGRGCVVYYLPRRQDEPVREVHVTGWTLYDGGKRK